MLGAGGKGDKGQIEIRNKPEEPEVVTTFPRHHVDKPMNFRRIKHAPNCRHHFVSLLPPPGKWHFSLIVGSGEQISPNCSDA